MKKKTLVLVLAVTVLLMTTSCATVEWLLEDTSTPATVVEPAPVAEQPKPAPVQTPKPLKPETPSLPLTADQTLVGSAAMTKVGNGIYLAQTADSVIVAYQGEDGHIWLAKPDAKGRWNTQKIAGIPVASVQGLAARDALVVVGYSSGGKVFSVTSADGGETFSNPVAIISSQQSASIQGIAIDENGHIHTVFHRHNSYWDYNYARSLDEGKTYRTFLDFTKLTDSNSTGYSGNLVAAHGNLYTLYQDNNDSFAAKISVSKDNGDTWKTSRIAPSSGGRLALAVDAKDPDLAYVAAFTKDGLTILRVNQATTDTPEYWPIYGDETLSPSADAYVSVHIAVATDRTVTVVYLNPATGLYTLLMSKDLGESWEQGMLPPAIQPKNFVWIADLESYGNEFFFARTDGKGNILLHGPDSKGQAASTAPVVQPVQNTAPVPQKTYTVGSRGPAGGLIVYDKGEDSNGWRYLELAPVETEFEGIGWGGSKTLVGELQKDIGSGLENTRRIVSIFGSKEPTKGNNYPAKMCDELVYNGYSDWFLPSKDELSLTYALITKGLDDFTDPGNEYFWTSSEENSTSTWYFVGIPGGQGYANKEDTKILTRAMRRFSDQSPKTPAPVPEKSYQIGSKGPAGGFIVYDKGSKTDGWRYLELAPAETEFAYIEWGGIGTLVGELKEGVGSGLENTRRIVNVFGPKEPKRGNNYPAKMCDDLVYGGYSDWFLPSIEELKLVYANLIAKNLGDIVDPKMHSFWSSNEQTASFAWYLIAANGSTSDAHRDFKNKTRAMRRF